jgi:hypothetical protein
MLDDLETDRRATLDELVQECRYQDVNARGAVTPGRPRRHLDGRWRDDPERRRAFAANRSRETH